MRTESGHDSARPARGATLFRGKNGVDSSSILAHNSARTALAPGPAARFQRARTRTDFELEVSRAAWGSELVVSRGATEAMVPVMIEASTESPDETGMDSRAAGTEHATSSRGGPDMDATALTSPRPCSTCAVRKRDCRPATSERDKRESSY